MSQDALIADLFSHVPVSAEARASVIALMSGPDRHYHDIGHLATLWGRHCLLGAGQAVAAPPWHRLIACAIAFHDAVYDPIRRDNEVRSAALWRASAGGDIEPWETDWVAGTILATADHLGAMPEADMAPDAWNARLWMLDLDLTPLGEAEDIFTVNTRELRKEYAHLDDAAWASGRRGFLRGLARRAVIYRTPAIAAAFDAQTRANLARELGSGEQ